MKFYLPVLVTVCLWSGCTCGRDQDSQAASGDAAELPAQESTARLVFLHGRVLVKRSGSLEWVEARPGMQLRVDDKIRTLRGSFANIRFARGGFLHVAPESLVAVSDLRREPRSQARKTAFMLVEGQVEAEMGEVKEAQSEFRIRTPSAEASVLHREVAFQ